MRLSRVRFTVRRMMVAVAVVAVSLNLVMVTWRCFSFSHRATLYSHLASHLSRYAGKYPADTVLPNTIYRRTAKGPTVALTGGGAAKLAAHYDALARKYKHAAAYPWLPIEPDPPPP